MSKENRKTGWVFGMAGGMVAAALLIGAPSGAQSAGTPYDDHLPSGLLEAMKGDGMNLVDPAEVERVRKTFGIEIRSVRFTSAGYALDLRYRVIDAEKAKQLHGVAVKPYLYHPATKSRLAVPSSSKVGSLTQGTGIPKAGRTYFTLFANPGHLVKPGDLVTLVIEGMVVEGIRVQ